MRKALDGLIASLAMRAGIKRVDILELALVGNPIMHHLLLGIDPTPLGGAPFALATDRAVRTTAAELGLLAHPGARVYVLPCIAGHVGADTAGVILAEEPHQAERMTLVVDVGTNAEIVLGDKRRLLAASSPTGPAFEGAQISGGQRAAPGAIERVRIDPATLEPRFRVIGVDAWSDEEAFATGVADTGITGICGSGIIEVVAEMFLAGIVTEDGVIDGGLAARTPRIVPDGRTFSYVLHEGDGGRRSGPRIAITQTDVRAIQLAKAALYAGVRLLMDQLEIDELDEIRLAGAFGSQIDPVHAMILGLIPDCDLGHVRSAGNAAGTGALIALLSGAARREIEGVVRRVEKIETAVEPRFQQHFVEAMAFPHKTAAFPNLGRGRGAPGTSHPDHGRRCRRRPKRTTTPARGRDRPEGGRLMDDPQRRRSGGRAARQALRLASHAEHIPFLTRKLAPFEVLGEEGLALIEQNADIDPRGGRRRVPRRRRGAPPAGRRRRRHRRRPGPLPARDVPPDRPGDRAAPVHPVRPEPGAQRRDRRDAHGLRPELRLTVRARPRRRPALRHDRGLPQLREADLRVALPPPLGRDGLRAGRRAGQQAPPRHGLFAHPLQRQAVHGLGHGAGTGARHGRDGPPDVRCRLPRGPHGHHSA